jgi:hypothetical protein
MMSRTVSWLCAVLLLITPHGAAAADRTEQEAALPPGLLLAIARTESGRRDPATGRIEPWPWALNAAGMGMLAATRAEAIAAVAALQARGLRSIDVGCLQVNLLHHPGAFASLEDAFDPLANARYAARFLRQLHLRAGGEWSQAIAWYHSATPARGEAYRLRVLADLAGHGTAPPAQARDPGAPLRLVTGLPARGDPVAPLLSAAALRLPVILPRAVAPPGLTVLPPPGPAPHLRALPQVITPRAN